jgi:outer membrane lipoprotein-sorting protein
MKRSVLLLMFIFSCGLVFSQTTIKDGMVIDHKAEKIVTQVAQKLKTDSPISISFSLIEKGVKTTGQKGEFTFSGNKYFGGFLNNRIYCDGVSVWIYQQEIEEVTINSVEDSQNDILNISKFISEANTKFRPKLIREESGNYIIDLTPKTKSEFSKVRLRINTQTNRISSLEVNYRNSNSYIYNITSYKTKVQLKDSDFVFNPKDYPSANIVDLR